MKNVTIYTTPTCPYCVRAKQLLTSLDIEYTEINALEDPEKRQELSDKYNWHTVPMIFIGDELIGGFDDLTNLHAEGKLMEKLAQ